MATVAKRPTGHKIIDQAVTATIGDDSGDALVSFTAHGLTTGDVVYIASDLEDYNGFWYVTTSGSDAFKISEYSTADFVEYFQDADIEYYQTQEHVWSSIFLPIIYKCETDRWPVNSVDTAHFILANQDDNGFTEITTPGPLKLGNMPLEFVKISGASTPEANGVWQIIEIVTANTYVINLPYDLSGNLIGATAQYYYNNYQVRVKVFAGLPDSHPWSHKKPFEEIAELSLTPDENNEVMFSVSDYLQGKIAIKNNPLLFSMPLNLDAFTGFFISVGESYDYSDGYTLGTAESEFEADDFEGYAVAGKLPFKNMYAGDYSEYVWTSGQPAKWLTNRERLLAVEGYYFDVSFIKPIPGDFQVIITKTIGDYSVQETIEYTDQGEGVYRIPITPDANYEEFCLYVNVLPTEGSGGEETPVTFPELDEFFPVGTGETWVTGSNPTVSLTGDVSLMLRSPTFAFTIGAIYRVTVGYDMSRSSLVEPTHQIALRATDSPNATFFETIQDTSTGTSGTLVLEFTATDPIMTRIHIQAADSGNIDFTVTSLLVETVTPTIPGTPGGVVTQEICIDVLETCETPTGIIVDTARRLLEDGDYRLLE